MVPSCTTAVNAAPGSSQPAKAGTTRRCAVDEIGRNSVSPCTMPRTMACRKVIRLSEAFGRCGTIGRGSRGDSGLVEGFRSGAEGGDALVGVAAERGQGQRRDAGFG